MKSLALILCLLGSTQCFGHESQDLADQLARESARPQIFDAGAPAPVDAPLVRPLPEKPKPAAPTILPVKPVADEAAWDRLAGYLASRYQLTESYASRVIQAAREAAVYTVQDPILILAVAIKESTLRHIGNPDGGADPRKPYGIMQVAGRWHPEKFGPTGVRVTSLEENMLIGGKVLQDYHKKARGDVGVALQLYSATPGQSWYRDHIVRIHQQLRSVLHK